MLMDIVGCLVLYVPDIGQTVKVDARDALAMAIIQNRVMYIVAVKKTKSFNVVCARTFHALSWVKWGISMTFLQTMQRRETANILPPKDSNIGMLNIKNAPICLQ